MIARRIVWCCAALGLAVGVAQAQRVPLHAASAQPLLNEYGQTASSGALVQFLLVNGHLYPPDVNGQPHPNNPVLFTTRIGNGVINSPATAGKFSAAITPRPGMSPAGGQVKTAIVARAFNASTMGAASFYEDSQVHTVELSRAIFYPVMNATTNPLDAADADGDGVNNSWEKSLGSDPQSRDTDGDGVSDGDEFLAGTSLTDEESFLAMVRVFPIPGGHLRAEWESVPGKQYQLQYAPGSLADPLMVFSNVNSVVTAVGQASSTTVTNGAMQSIGIYRVRLVY